MDGLTLLQRAREAGLQVEATGNKLMIRGPKRAEPLVELLAEHKAEVLLALAYTAQDAEQLPWFEHLIPQVEGEPSLEQPCAGRRGRVQELPGAFLHFCAECGRFGAFGYGVSLRAGLIGIWYCAEHRPKRAS